MVLFVYDFFTSELKPQVYGMLHRVFFFLKEELKSTGIV